MAATVVSVGREYRAIGLISVAHFASHLYQLALAPLIPFIAPDLGLSYTAIGGVITAFYVATAVLQTPVGFLVDRVGARKVLVAGLFINGVALALAGTVSSYWLLVVLFLVAGVGNSVFHPADFSLMSSSVAENRLGRAFSLHTVGGTGGTAAAPVTMVLLATLWDWRVALVAAGTAGIALALVIGLFGGSLREVPAARREADGEAAEGPGWRFLLSRPMLVFLLFYVATSAANSGMINFSLVAMGQIYDAPLAVVTTALSVFLIAGIVGVLPGGFLADRTRRHDLVLVIAYLVLAASVMAVGTGVLPIWLLFGALALGGAMRGVVGPARDILVRRAAPAASVGTAFAFVTTGFMVGNSVTPVLYGWLLDIGSSAAVFFVSAGFTLVAVGSVFLSRERSL